MTTTRPAVPDRLMTTAEVAEIFGVKKETIRDWMRKGMLPGSKVGNGPWKIPRSAVVKLATEKYGLTEVPA